jgi:hypothetical protein
MNYIFLNVIFALSLMITIGRITEANNLYQIGNILSFTVHHNNLGVFQHNQSICSQLEK